MTSPHDIQPNLLNDFRKILALFDKETQIYKEQISILRSSIDEIQTNDANRINMISQELSELRAIINNLEQQTQREVAAPINSDGNNPDGTIIQTNATPAKTRDINDYLCQICLDLPRDCLLEPCMHFCLCVRCIKLLTEPKCPVCRRTIDFYQNVFS